ncbi:MAG: acyltransferase domain-containing protein, partial [Armatimonadia bacterium]|nr:acyltransferase domain-containing protein [Armatimonadia bacterium]
LTTSIAALEALKANGLPGPAACLGHSLGEYTALVAAEAMSFDTALKLVRKRGLFMREAGASVGGAMAAVIGADDDALKALIDEVRGDRVLVAANYNAPDQTVISGEQSAVSDAGAAINDRGLGRYMPLRVSGAFHSSLMAPAADKMAAELDAADISDAAVPVVPNATAEPTTNAGVIRKALKDQITASVLWTDSVRKLRPLSCEAAVEIGARNVLGGMVNKIDPNLPTHTIHDADSLKGCLDDLGVAP